MYINRNSFIKCWQLLFENIAKIQKINRGFKHMVSSIVFVFLRIIKFEI